MLLIAGCTPAGLTYVLRETFQLAGAAHRSGAGVVLGGCELGSDTEGTYVGEDFFYEGGRQVGVEVGDTAAHAQHLPRQNR